MTNEEMQQWAGEAERLHALATSGTGGAEMAAATLRLRGVEYVGALLAAVAAERARCAAVCRAVATARADALREAIRECTVVSLELSSDFRLRVGMCAAERCAAAIAALAGCP